MRSRTAQRAAIALLILTFGIGATVLAVRTHQVGRQDDGSILAPNGRTLTPAGTHIDVNDRPLGMVVSPGGSQLAVVTGSNFGARALHLIDVQTWTLKQTIGITNSFVGVAFNPGGDTLFVGGGPSNDVKIFKATNGVFAAAGTIPISGGPQPSGLTINANGSRLYVALNQTHEVGVIDTATRAVTRVKVGIYPYTAVISADGRKVYVSNWGGKVPGPSDFTDGQNPVVVDRRTGIPATGTVSVLDTASNALVKHIDVGLHPTGMALSPSGDRVYVTNANSDTISVIDTATDTVAKTLAVGERHPERAALLGSSPNAMAVSPDGQTLFVAKGAENAIAVVDADGSGDEAVRGLIPTGWYPMAVALDRSGTQLFVANGYGFGSIAPIPASRIGRSFPDRVGVLSMLTVPDRGQLARFTQEVRRNNRGVPSDADGNDGDHGQDDG